MTNATSLSKTLMATVRLFLLAFVVLIGGIVSTSYAGMSDPEYTGNTTSTGSDSSSSSKDDDCGGSKTAVDTLKAFSKSDVAFLSNSNAQAIETQVTNAKEFAKNPKKYYTTDLWCLNDIVLYFDVINKLIAAESLIAAAITAAISSFATAVCDKIKTTVMNTLNNALDKVCVPLPDLNFSMTTSTSTTTRKTCDGKSLSALMGVEAAPGLDSSAIIPKDLLTAPMNRFIETNTVGKGSYSLRNGSSK
jgi:hypothetical protein